jgi:two-component system sensor histidine kinase BaeS
VGSIGVRPVTSILAITVLIVITIAVAASLRRYNRHARSLRRLVLVTALVAVALGAIGAFILSWLMILDSDQLVTALTVLLLTAIITSALVAVATAPLGRDARHIETTLRAVEAGDRSQRTSLVRRDELGHVGRALDELTTNLDRLEAEQRHLEAERTAMITSVSHDLRTPLTALRAAVEALTDHIAPDPDRYYRAMARDVDALASLVDDLFLLVRLEHGTYDLEPADLDLTELADDAIEALTPAAEAKHVRLQLDATNRVHITGNPAALARVIRNLLDNAIRHAPEGTTVHVSVDGEHRPTVHVIDQGPGFPAAFADRAFEQFARADTSRNRETGGAGLGLAVARGLIDAHHGTIRIDPPPGGRVSFELPAAATAEPPAA